MSVKLTDLQLIYGVAGARAKFESLVYKLIRAEHPGAGRIRIRRGDDGIDVYVGEITDLAGIDVYQCKYFPDRLGPAQRSQIRKSFARCRKSRKYVTRTWTLCVPIDPALDELAWFERWRKREAGGGITIRDIWGGSALEALLCQPKNVGIKEAYFKEEHLRQIRDMHGMLKRLVDGLEQRHRSQQREREDARARDAEARQATAARAFADGMRHRYAEQVRAALRGIRPVRSAPGCWEVLIRPTDVRGGERIGSLPACREIVERCQSRWQGWAFPEVERGGRTTGKDWAGGLRADGVEVESWALSQQGVFVFIQPIVDDLMGENYRPISPRWQLPAGFSPGRFLDTDSALIFLTLAFRFAANLSRIEAVCGQGGLEVSIRLTGTQDRVLAKPRDPSSWSECYTAGEPLLENAWCCAPADLQKSPDATAARSLLWFVHRFGWDRVAVETLMRVQERLMSRG